MARLLETKYTFLLTAVVQQSESCPAEERVEIERRKAVFSPKQTHTHILEGVVKNYVYLRISSVRTA